MQKDVGIDTGTMKSMQYLTVFICFLMNLLDGMDVLIISFTAPAIAKDWHISPANLGVVFSSGLVGMTVGAIFLAPFADKIGRKSMMLIAALVMGTCILLTSLANGVQSLLLLRFLSGLGIGAMLTSSAALTAEYTPNKSRDFWVSVVVAGYPVGAVLTGMISAQIIAADGWPHMFELAGYFTFLALPILYFFLSESLDFYLKSGKSNALDKINQIHAKLGLASIRELPVITNELKEKIHVSTLLNPGYRKATLQVWTALFLAFCTLYFLMNWIPKLAANAGLSMEAAIYSGTIFNLGAILGIPAQGYLSSRFGLKKTIGYVFLATAFFMAIFGLFAGSNIILAILFLLGFGVQGGFVGLYAVATRMYPTRIRSTGLGWAVGAGRVGGIIGPIVGGFLVAMGLGMTQSFWFFAVPTLLAGIMTLQISSKEIS
jgi:benzoate transport